MPWFAAPGNSLQPGMTLDRGPSTNRRVSKVSMARSSLASMIFAWQGVALPNGRYSAPMEVRFDTVCRSRDGCGQPAVLQDCG